MIASGPLYARKNGPNSDWSVFVLAQESDGLRAISVGNISDLNEDNVGFVEWVELTSIGRVYPIHAISESQQRRLFGAIIPNPNARMEWGELIGFFYAVLGPDHNRVKGARVTEMKKKYDAQVEFTGFVRFDSSIAELPVKDAMHIVAHEAGHVVMNHTALWWWAIIVAAVLVVATTVAEATMGGFWFATLAAFLVAVFGLRMTRAAIEGQASRFAEYAVDEYNERGRPAQSSAKQYQFYCPKCGYVREGLLDKDDYSWSCPKCGRGNYWHREVL